MKRPNANEYPEFFGTYIKQTPKRGALPGLLRKAWKETNQLLAGLPPEMGDFAYAPDKWTIKQMLIHMIDAERIFAFRALWFMRGDRAPLPGFNQDFWMQEVDLGARSVNDLLKEWKLVRDHTMLLIKHCSEEQSQMTGTASNWKMSVRALMWVILGHHLHHLEVLKTRYLV